MILAHIDVTKTIKRFALLLGAFSFLAGCSLLDKKEPLAPDTHFSWSNTKQTLEKLADWELIGKVNIRSSEESLTAAINRWKQDGSVYDVDLSSTFMGLGAANIKGSAVVVTLTESGEDPIISDDPDFLVAEALGLPLPITHLPYWIKGLPEPSVESQIRFSDSGLLKSIEQSGWQINYQTFHFSHAVPLPKKIKLRRDDIHITLAIKQWTPLSL